MDICRLCYSYKSYNCYDRVSVANSMICLLNDLMGMTRCGSFNPIKGQLTKYAPKLTYHERDARTTSLQRERSC
ncbi:hypothetical protein KS4_09500 [Poriferisphaera corsica]|uniref:Uncharacterized protein n=1 Tax=Poriferisphaera corsica TaxID=2528020 RepID=A0A517YRS5_9BACT|nr:hypothetical protein KS4_09500 [Poriferisphaera corsica]